MASPEGLAEQFEAPAEEAWMALVEKALKGADFEKRLVSKTDDGLRIDPLYTRKTAIGALQDMVPGEAPYTRGTKSKAEGAGWDILGLVCEKDPGAANKAALADLEGGATGLMIQVAGPGQFGVAMSSASNAAELLAGVYVDYVSLNLRAGLNALPAAKALLAGLETFDVAREKLRGALNISPIANYARFGTAGAPLNDAMATAVGFAKETSEKFPGFTAILADGRVAHEAGSSEVTELAVLASSLVAYLRAFEADGVAPDVALRMISFGVATDADLFLTAAKLRAARQIIWRIADAAGAGDAVAEMKITATTSERMMAKRDVWTNMLRTTAATTAAALGGATGIVVHPFSWPLGKPDEFAARIARNQQLVAAEESSLGRVVDPAGGSWYVENLTETLAKESWQRFQDLEAEGGVIASLDKGLLQKRIAETAEKRAARVATGRAALTGVSAFPLLGDDGVTVAPHDAVEAVATTELAVPLSPRRAAEPFEVLRDAADRFEEKAGQKPRVFLASLGTVADHNIRTTWMKNFLAAGGIEALVTDGYASAHDAAVAFNDSGASIACICSNDGIYAEIGAETAKALKGAGAQRVELAGKPGDFKGDLDAAGVDTYLFVGVDALDRLRDLHAALGVPA